MAKKFKKDLTLLEQLEHDFYELKPYIFVFLSMMCFYNKNESSLLLMSGFLFGVAGIAIIYKRYVARYYR